MLLVPGLQLRGGGGVLPQKLAHWPCSGLPDLGPAVTFLCASPLLRQRGRRFPARRVSRRMKSDDLKGPAQVESEDRRARRGGCELRGRLEGSARGRRPEGQRPGVVLGCVRRLGPEGRGRGCWFGSQSSYSHQLLRCPSQANREAHIFLRHLLEIPKKRSRSPPLLLGVFSRFLPFLPGSIAFCLGALTARTRSRRAPGRSVPGCEVPS